LCGSASVCIKVHTDRQCDEGLEIQQDGSDGESEALKVLDKEKKISEDEKKLRGKSFRTRRKRKLCRRNARGLVIVEANSRGRKPSV
jgi:hypothetical protein